jgi:hypothetical protein
MRMYTEYAHMRKAVVPEPIMSVSSHVSRAMVEVGGDGGGGDVISLHATLVRAQRNKTNDSMDVLSV